jgi:zinc transport system substrate-binding protein
VSHPAFAYLGQDYGLKQLSIEFEGKDPTPQTMNNTLERARREKIKTIFLQPQYTRKGAELIAKLLHASLITLDPYSEDYLNNMWTMAQKIHEGL